MIVFYYFFESIKIGNQNLVFFYVRFFIVSNIFFIVVSYSVIYFFNKYYWYMKYFFYVLKGIFLCEEYLVFGCFFSKYVDFFNVFLLIQVFFKQVLKFIRSINIL